VDRKKLIQILNYIEGYSWQKHLANENKKLMVEEKLVTEELIVQVEASSVSEKPQEKRAWYHVLADWFRGLFK
jgi:hypothetical protein